MALPPGRKLGPYEILAPIGAGGMGEVYKAKDARLHRTVAVKVLPPELSSDAERRGRFEREARAASALNHPNITTVYDIGQDDGTRYIVMEFVEGKTLRELVDDGPLPTEKMLPLATQIADGLAKAHQAGIAHRDLKPENLMATDDGLVKILDFGLAKLMPQSTDADSEMDTVTKATQQGVILGTLQYMSPEQAASRPIDYRSDQFSFGSILYEMATGRTAFKKDTMPQTLAAIIDNEPEPLRKLNNEIPTQLSAIVERCLAKDADER
jgi:serine/threonine protein kinase